MILVSPAAPCRVAILLGCGVLWIPCSPLPRAAAQECALVSTYNSDTIVFIDTKTNAVSHTRVLPPASQFFCNLEAPSREIFPSGIALTPNGSRAYIKTGACGAIRLDTASLETAFILGAGSFLNEGAVAVTRDGRFAYLTDSPSDSVLVLDIAADEFIAAIPVATAPTDLAMTPDGRFVYVVSAAQVDSTPGTVSVIDTEGNTVAATVGVGNRPAGIAMTPDGSLAYVANALSDTVSVIEPARNAVIATVPVAGAPLWPTLSLDGHTVYLATNDGLIVLDAASGAVTATIPITAGRSAITGDGSALYVLDDLAEALSVLNTAHNALAATIPLPSRACNGSKPCQPAGIVIGSIPGGCPPCPGDCNGDEKVLIDELITGVNIVLGAKPASDCRALDLDVSGAATVDELIKAVNAALTDCAVP